MDLYGLKLVMPPPGLPVDLEAMRRQIHLSDGDQSRDAWLLDALDEACTHCQKRIDRQFLTATYDLSLDRFPLLSVNANASTVSNPYYMDNAIGMPLSPLQSITWIKYLDPANVWQTWDPSRYVVDCFREPGRIAPAYGQVWPITIPSIASVQIRFVCGYGATPESVPGTLRRAIKLLVAHWFLNREAVTDQQKFDLPQGVEALLMSEAWGSYREA